MELFNEYRSKKQGELNEGKQAREAGIANTLKDILNTETFTIYPARNADNALTWTLGNDEPEFKMIQNAIKARIKRAEAANENEAVPLYKDHVASKSNGISYLTEEENQQLDEMMVVFENEYDGDIRNLDEGFFGKLVGGAAGFLAGPMIGRIIAKALGIEKGILYDMFTSRLVSTALGAAISKAWTEKK
jgi:hypothetical protein